MSNNEMQEEPEVSMFTDTELLNAIDKYRIELTFDGAEGGVFGASDCVYDTLASGSTARIAIANCITAIKDEQGENQ